MSENEKQAIDVNALIEASQERNMPIEKVFIEEMKIPWYKPWKKKKVLKLCEEAILKEIRSMAVSLQTIPPNEKSYTITTQNMKILCEAYDRLTKNNTDWKKTVGVICGSIVSTLVVCEFERRGNQIIGKGLTTILKPKNPQ